MSFLDTYNGHIDILIPLGSCEREGSKITRNIVHSFQTIYAPEHLSTEIAEVGHERLF